ncbi:hypothetical protein HCN44_008597 [Aphidius gifuensis]|uniref:Extended synaptotagmin-2 n=1 Tax=Aphidius gifuensis TaxID=684658 RepID=A0A834XMF0_APHGI|nr:extended synaptotagmin-2 isoform X1 [Aphidius gifuensis]KAF7989923.1 hypothetical protein HCN44_008597 [Aphidius gifuensis]
MSSESIENQCDQKKKLPVVWPYMTVSSFSLTLITRLIAAAAIWGWGYTNWSFGWLLPPILLTTWKYESDRNSELKRLTVQASVMANEKDIIISKMNDLPSWVYFPDFDRAEWLNKILCKIWPGMNHFSRQLVRETIQPSIVQSLAEYKITGFQFGRFVLGRIPPKIYGVKVYENNTSRNEIILDCDMLYAGDCDISFSLGNIKGGIRDFQLRGMARIVLKPMLNVMPLVGGIQIFFLNNPSIDFNLVGAIDVLDFPGFNQALRKVIREQISKLLVMPNKLAFSLSQDVPTYEIKMPEPEGLLRIHVVQAKHLMKKDIGMLGKGKSDPYAIITVGSQEFKTKTIDNTVDPKWDYWCECLVMSSVAQQLEVVLWDHDEAKGDENLGSILIEISQVKEKRSIDNWFTLDFAKHGSIQLRLTWLNLTKDIVDLQAAIIETQELGVTSMSTALLLVFIDSAKNLPCLRGSKQPDVYLEACVGSKKERTGTILRSCDPVWEQGFTLLVANPETSNLNIRVIDEKTNLVVGSLTYMLSTLLTHPALEETQQPFSLQNAGPESKVIMSLALRIVKYENPDPFKKVEESTISNSSDSSLQSTPLKKQLSKESIRNLKNNSGISGSISPVTLDEDDGVISNQGPNNQVPHSGLIHRNPSLTSFAGEAKLGRIQLTFRYSVPRQKLVIVVHKIANLPASSNDLSNIPDPYVKLYLLPDRHKETKRKTSVMRDSCNPVYDEQFEYLVSQGDLNTRVLEVTVCAQKGWLGGGSNVMGQVHINLSEIDITKAISAWYDLLPESKD